MDATSKSTDSAEVRAPAHQRLTDAQSGRVLDIAYRPNRGDPMMQTTECEILANRGLSLENRKPGEREVTFLSAEAWANACRDLQAVLPWALRRANLLVEGIDLARSIGQALAIGDVRVQLHTEATPCDLMDQQFPGLRAALEPECRGGVCGQVLASGTVHVGDRVTILPSSDVHPS